MPMITPCHVRFAVRSRTHRCVRLPLPPGQYMGKPGRYRHGIARIRTGRGVARKPGATGTESLEFERARRSTQARAPPSTESPLNSNGACATVPVPPRLCHRVCTTTSVPPRLCHRVCATASVPPSMPPTPNMKCTTLGKTECTEFGRKTGCWRI